MASVFILFYVILFNFDTAFVQFDLNSSARLIKYCLNSAPNINFQVLFDALLQMKKIELFVFDTYKFRQSFVKINYD